MQCVKLKAKVIRVIEGNEFLIRGDAGSRTRVREQDHQDAYIHSLYLSFALKLLYKQSHLKATLDVISLLSSS